MKEIRQFEIVRNGKRLEFWDKATGFLYKICFTEQEAKAFVNHLNEERLCKN